MAEAPHAPCQTAFDLAIAQASYLGLKCTLRVLWRAYAGPEERAWEDDMRLERLWALYGVLRYSSPPAVGDSREATCVAALDFLASTLSMDCVTEWPVELRARLEDLQAGALRQLAAVILVRRSHGVPAMEGILAQVPPDVGPAPFRRARGEILDMLAAAADGDGDGPESLTFAPETQCYGLAGPLPLLPPGPAAEGAGSCPEEAPRGTPAFEERLKAFTEANPADAYDTALASALADLWARLPPPTIEAMLQQQRTEGPAPGLGVRLANDAGGAPAVG